VSSERPAPARDPDDLPLGEGSVPPFSALPPMLRRVLIADDNRAFRRFLADALSKHGFEVHEAKDGEEALRLTLEKRPWLILADVSMPVMDGFQFCKRVRAHSLVSHTPLVFLSGWDDYRDRHRGLRLGADEFLSKQTPVRELLIRIFILLQRYSDAGASTGGSALEGGIEVIGPPALLQMWHQGRLSGVCSVRSGTRVFSARFREGEIVGASLEQLQGEAAVYAFLEWTRGHFRFVPGEVAAGAPLGVSFDQLLLEGCRRLDEARREADQPPDAG
jgi:CheY-like chemotaxis protein